MANPVAQPIIPAPLNTTVFGLVQSTTFSPTTSARWINILFVYSLVLSIASALFGILAKQWIREYLKWNTAIGDPRENVLVRQIRFEAWNDWNVEGVLWSIPFLLELAMILFLAGIVLLVWTLDSIVAVAVTAIVAIFLGITATFTVLPIFVKKCPYKSPTAWVMLRIFRIARSAILNHIVHDPLEYIWWTLVQDSDDGEIDENFTWSMWFHLRLEQLFSSARRTCFCIIAQVTRAFYFVRNAVLDQSPSRIPTPSLPQLSIRKVASTLQSWPLAVRDTLEDIGPLVRWQDR